MDRSTSLGNQNKYYKEGYWYKEDLLGYEGLAEEVVMDILMLSSLKYEEFAKYKQIKGWGCKSRNFLDKGQSVVTFSRLFKINGYDYEKELTRIEESKKQMLELIDKVREYSGVDVKDYLRKVFTLDSFIFNEDRHLNNLSLILNEDGTFKTCPIFDNGLSLLANTKDYPNWGNTTVISQIKQVKSKPFGTDFVEQMNILGVGFQISEISLKSYLEKRKEELGRIYNILIYSIKMHKEEGLLC